jgi:uncharacterized membrane protein
LFRKNLDLLWIYAVAVISAGLGISWLHEIPGLAPVGILMVLLLPGYVFSQLILPVLPPEERLLVSLGLSIVITTLSGLLLNFTHLGLNPITWSLWMAAVTLVGTGWLWLKRHAQPEPAAPPDRPLSRIHWRPVLLYGFALACLGLAVIISNSFSNRLDSPLTQLWAAFDSEDARRMTIGIRNQEGRPMVYDLVVTQAGGGLLQRQRVDLADGRTYTIQLTFQQPAAPPVQVALVLPEEPNQVYRQVKVVALPSSAQVQGK